MITRRTFLSGVAVAAIVLGLATAELGAWPHRGSANPGGTFYGNPNVTISSIDTSGGIVKSRASGGLPAYVQVSASAIMASGTSRPYEDLEYTFNFGDPTGNEVFTNPVTHGSVNANIQIGPEAVYCYRTAGIKTITCTIRGKNGATYTVASVQTTFTASATGWPDYYFDSTAGSDGDGSIGSPWNDPVHILWNTSAPLRGVTQGFGANLHIKRGSNFSGGLDSIIYCYGGSLRIDAYGSGADPIFNCTNPNTLNQAFGFAAPFQISTFSSSRSTSDVVVSNLQFVTNANYSVSLNAINAYPNQIFDIYFDHCTLFQGVYLRGGGTNLTQQALYNVGFWGGSMTYNPNFDIDNFHGDMNAWCFCFGITFIANATVSTAFTTLTHTLYVTCLTHTLFRYLTFDQTRLQNQLKMSCNISTTDCPYHLVADNSFTFTDGLSPGRSNEDSGFKNYLSFVVSGNLFYAYHNVAIDIEDPASYTIRDNYIGKNNTNNEAISTRASCFTQTGLNIYRNNIYGNNTHISLTNFGWDTACNITYNVFWNTAVSGNAATCIKIVQADQVASGTVVNYNQYYSTNNNANPPKLFSNDFGSTFLTFAQWQAAGWDLNGSYLAQAPAWPNPAIGNFGQFVA